MSGNAMNPNKKISYTNTLFFTIFNAIFAIILVLLLFFRIIPSEYMYFIIGVEVGVVLIVAYCIYRIIRFEKFLEAMRNPKNLYIPFDSCPDYFVKSDDQGNGKTICSSQYTVTDRNNTNYIMKIYPASVHLPPVLDKNTEVSSSAKYDKFYLNEINESKQLQTMKDKCGVLYVEPTDANMVQYQGYTKVPWTSVRGRCEGLFN